MMKLRRIIQTTLRGAEPYFFGEKRIWGAAGVSVTLLLCVFYFQAVRAPALFPQGEFISIAEGMTLQRTAAHLKELQVIRSPFLLQNAVILFGGEKSVFAGDYYLPKREGVFSIARRIATGTFGIAPVAIRIREGATIAEMAAQFEQELSGFNREKFLSLAADEEGFLFPDTYHFLPNAQPEQVIVAMKENFSRRTRTLAGELEAFDRPLDEVIIMASLLEKEGERLEDKRIIASVLWNRIEIGMPLQVDAVFGYLIGKGTAELSLEDLKIDSPYNTYLYRGLPPGPIGSPSLESIRAAVTPIDTDYLYYLADQDGVTYFSRTFEEHKRKKELYVN